MVYFDLARQVLRALSPQQLQSPQFAEEQRLSRVSHVLLERVTSRLDRITESHLELETAQKNTTVLLNRFIEESAKRGAEEDQRITNLTVLVDQLVKKDVNGQ